MTPCDCVESCQLADLFTPATRELMVFTKNSKRYFDLDSVRGELSETTGARLRTNDKRSAEGYPGDPKRIGAYDPEAHSPNGAPPLDWWQIPSPKPQPVTAYEGDPMTATFYVGDAIETMGKLPENSVDLILTSPPFLALRSYLPADHPDKALEGGSQATPGQYIDWLVDVVEACDRVLAPHGSMCIELGDTYAGSGGAGGDYDPGGLREGQDKFDGSGYSARQDTKYAKVRRDDHPSKRSDAITNLHGKIQGGGTGWPLTKSLSLIPELFRLTLVYGTNPLTGRQTERWRLRNVVRWVRPNPPVGALGDKFRPATSELMVFCKSAKRYFDLDAVRSEPQGQPNFPSNGPKSIEREALGIDGQGRYAQRIDSNPAGAPPLDWWNIPLLEGEEETRYGPKEPKPDTTRHLRAFNKLEAGGLTSSHAFTQPENPLGAPPLDWWEIPPGGYRGSHYAVFPPELCIKPIKAMSPERVCRQCGEPSFRITEREVYFVSTGQPTKGHTMRNDMGPLGHDGAVASRLLSEHWTDCGHDDWRPGLVLDPFGGSGTTALVATGHGRDCILIDLDERNYELALQRVGPFILERGEL